MTPAHRYLTAMAARVTEWDAALIRQAVLGTAWLRDGRVSANDFRDYLPEVAQGAVGLTIRQLPTKKHGALIRKATVQGHPITVPSTAESTHGKPIQVWELTPAGRDAARELIEGRVAA
ncbi:hypothetical protein [Nocardiopsis sp. NPDC058789]|uniref:hypothetical protein n=1 Tax=Nocardiopsis sp. NPDC058789 TaxID=3346634 RepID=UPI00366B188E